MENTVMMFAARSFWLDFGIRFGKRKKKILSYFDAAAEITDRDQAINCLLSVLQKSNARLLSLINIKGTYSLLFDLVNILNIIMEYYLEEKISRTKIMEANIRETALLDTLTENRNIERNIIDACNIWIENCVLYQTNLNDLDNIPQKANSINTDLLLDLYIYGFSSQALSLLRLSAELKENSFYGLLINPESDFPLNVLKYHPVLYSNMAVAGNQSTLSDERLVVSNKNIMNDGFKKEYGVSFSDLLGVLSYFQNSLLEDNPYAIAIYTREDFISQINNLDPPIDGKMFLSCASINKNKLKEQLKNDEETIWRIGANKYRLEIRPVIELEDGNVFICSAACKQAMQIWYSYCMNGGSCYEETGGRDHLQTSMEKINHELATALLNKAREIFRKNYFPTCDEINVNYKRIFGEQSIDYGDYDIVFYADKEKELFLAESKYLSDSLNSSGLINDYKKMFAKGKYYDHCRARYDLVLRNPAEMKRFIGINPDEHIRVHFLFISSKPMEIELQDKDGIVTFLPVRILDGFIKGRFISEDGTKTIRPEISI